jgi:hypothetical protein
MVPDFVQLRTEADRLRAREARVRDHVEYQIEEMNREESAGILEPDWCRAHRIMLMEMLEALDSPVEPVRVTVHDPGMDCGHCVVVDRDDRDVLMLDHADGDTLLLVPAVEP